MVKLEVTIDVIIHATEDVVKFFKTFEELFDLEEEEFSVSKVTGHFENPISILRAKITKNSAKMFLGKFLETLSEDQKSKIVSEIKERTENSSLHLRLDKQEFVQGRISFIEKEAIKLKIHTPIYNKKDTVKVFSKLFHELT